MTAATTVRIDTLDRLRALAGTASEGSPLHPIGLREVSSGPGAAGTVADVLRRLGVPQGRAVVLSDPTPKASSDGDVQAVVTRALAASHQACGYLLRPAPGQPQLLADEPTVARAVEAVRGLTPDCLVTVGSGTLADIGKVVAHRLDLVHVVVQTAASVNGFADDQSVLLVNGAKRTTPSRWPDALLVDSDVLARAPLAMTRSGLGDQLSMFTAGADWYLAGAVGLDPSYSPGLVRLIREGSNALLDSAVSLGRGEPRSVMLLADALTRGGLAMGIAGRTSPSSGAEHTIAHLLEMAADARDAPVASHGSRVGVTGVVAAAVWHRVRDRLAAGDVRIRMLDPQVQQARVRAAFGQLDGSGVTARECWTAYSRKLTWITRNRDAVQRLCDRWVTDHEPAVADLLTGPDRLAGVLGLAGAPARFAQLDPAPDADTVRWAVQHCHLMRDRFGVVDLAELIGVWTPGDVAGVLARTQRSDGTGPGTEEPWQ
jgi:glycerol-1-phosphate dehydrogenase [NAD(P)+]